MTDEPVWPSLDKTDRVKSTCTNCQLDIASRDAVYWVHTDGRDNLCADGVNVATPTKGESVG